MLRKILAVTAAVLLIALTGGARVNPGADALTKRTQDHFTIALRGATARCGDQPGPNLRKVPGQPSSRRYHARTHWLNHRCLPRSVRRAAIARPSSAAPTAAAPATAPPTGRSSGGYCGAYQFDDQTWRSVGGSGSACGASQAEQDKRAAMLQGQRGNSPWPVCGRGGASLAQIRQCENGGRY